VHVSSAPFILIPLDRYPSLAVWVGTEVHRSGAPHLRSSANFPPKIAPFSKSV
jgi:hypothetical protein